jgi:tetratricopeptide (TPR) repeat protein
MRIRTAAVCAMLALASPTSGATRDEYAIIQEAAEAIGKSPAKALKLVEPLIARSGVMTPKPATDYICAYSSTDALAKLIGKAAEKRAAVAVAPWVCEVVFLKGFVLIDLNRRAEAEPYLRRVTELDPTNAHYLNEYAEWWKIERQWQKSYDLFAASAAMAPLQAEDVRATRHARAKRGMGFALIELDQLDEAERQFNESLVLEPGNGAALYELNYIKEVRARSAAKPTT